MSSFRQDFSEIDKLLRDIVEQDFKEFDLTLYELFEKRLKHLDIAFSTSAKLIGIENRALKGILMGNQKVVDFVVLIRIANFLQITNSNFIERFVVELKKNFDTELSFAPEKIDFITKNFDLAALKKVGFIKSLTDYKHIEERITTFFGYKSIFEYVPTKTGIAFSSGIITPKSELNRECWIETSKIIFKEVSNPNNYDRRKLIEYFPEIRGNSKNVEFGLLDVIQSLYKLGITVIFLDSLPSMHLRGATFAVNDKPCIVLTNYRGFYATLWFALIHELFHVLFDWEEILEHKYHISDENSTQVSVIEKEREADDFARAYLFSIEKTKEIKKSTLHHKKVVEFAENNDIHYSFIYLFIAHDSEGKSNVSWSRAHKFNPDINKFISKFNYGWSETKSINEAAKSLKLNIFN